jgi:HSP20 family molecular chaperone IbpA
MVRILRFAFATTIHPSCWSSMVYNRHNLPLSILDKRITTSMMKFRPSFLLLATKFPTTTTSFVVPAAAVVAASHFSTKMKATADRSIAVEEDGSTRAVHDDPKQKPVMNKKTEKPAQGLQRTPARGWLSPWAGFDVFRNDPFFASDWDRDFFHEPMSILKSSFFDDVDNTPGGRLLRSSPGYEIKEDGKTYQIAVDIPEGVGLGDIHVNLEQDGHVLHVAGQRKVESKDGFSETRFDQRFTIGSNVD